MKQIILAFSLLTSNAFAAATNCSDGDYISKPCGATNCTNWGGSVSTCPSGRQYCSGYTDNGTNACASGSNGISKGPGLVNIKKTQIKKP